MGSVDIRAGNGTHTGRMLGYCPSCSLYHDGARSRASCSRLMNANNPREELAAWAALKDAVFQERRELES